MYKIQLFDNRARVAKITGNSLLEVVLELFSQIKEKYRFDIFREIVRRHGYGY